MKTNLIKKLALALALTSTITISTSCSKKVDKTNLTALLSVDTSLDISDTIFVFPENSTIDHYVSFITHYDSENKNYHAGMCVYENHKDYRVTYKVSKDEYFNITKFDTRIKDLSQEQISTLEKIVENYTPIEVKEFNYDKSYYDHANTFDENWRFNEEEYLNSLE